MQRFNIKYKSTNKDILKHYRFFLSNILRQNHINFVCFTIPTVKNRIILLKSPHVYKKAKEHFESETFSFVLYLSLSIKNLKYLSLNKPKAIRLIVKKT
jgi:ribosomal protein S10